MLAFAIAVYAGIAGSAQAGLALSIRNNVASPGSSTNSFYVDLTNNGTSSADDVSIAGFSFELSVSSSLVTFSMVSNATGATPYIFGSDGLFGSDITNVIGDDASSISASDNLAAADSSVTLGYGQTVGLGRVFFSLAANAPAKPIPILFTSFPATSVNGPDPFAPSFDVSQPPPGNLQLIVEGDSEMLATPEPSTIIVSVQALLLTGFFARYVRRRRARVPL